MSRRPSHIILAALLSAGLFTIPGCETWKGLGKDVSNLGDDMQGQKKSETDNEDQGSD